MRIKKQLTKQLFQKQETNKKPYSNSFGSTFCNFINKDQQQYATIQFVNSSRDRSFQTTKKQQIYQSKLSPQIAQMNCTKFMKAYVDKLKKQRKRQKKKSLLSHQQKQDKSYASCQINALPFIQMGKKRQQNILVTQKINPISFKSHLLSPAPNSERTFNNQNIVQIIKEIKQYKSKMEVKKQKEKQKQKQKQKIEQHKPKVLPLLQTNTNFKIVKRSRRLISNFQKLEPWAHEMGGLDASFEQFK